MAGRGHESGAITAHAALHIQLHIQLHTAANKAAGPLTRELALGVEPVVADGGARVGQGDGAHCRVVKGLEGIGGVGGLAAHLSGLGIDVYVASVLVDWGGGWVSGGRG